LSQLDAKTLTAAVVKQRNPALAAAVAFASKAPPRAAMSTQGTQQLVQDINSGKDSAFAARFRAKMRGKLSPGRSADVQEDAGAGQVHVTRWVLSKPQAAGAPRALGAPQLRELDVSHSPGLSAEGMLFLLDRSPMLQTLDVNGCMQLDTSVLQRAVELCPAINKLNVSHVSGVNDTLLDTIAKHLWMEDLDLTHCHAVTDGGLKRLASECVGLQRVRLRWCKKITTESVMFLLRKCRSLTYLDVSQCSEVALRPMRPIMALRPWLTVVHDDLLVGAAATKV
jgi:hypothetical protein